MAYNCKINNMLAEFVSVLIRASAFPSLKSHICSLKKQCRVCEIACSNYNLDTFRKVKLIHIKSIKSSNMAVYAMR